MGCWNETDMLTQLPIRVGEPVKYFVLLENSYARKGSTSESTDVYTPIYLPLSGEYGDYGNIENIVHDPAFLMLSEHFESHHSLSLETALKSVERGELSYEDRIYGIAMVHNSIYEKAIAFHGASTTEYWSFGNHSPVSSNIKNARGAMEWEFNEMVETNKQRESQRLLIYIADSMFAVSLRMHGFFPRLLEYYWKQDFNPEPLINFRLFCDFVSLTRKLWMPSSACGSQSTNYEYYKVLAEAASDLIEAGLKYDKELFDEED